MSKHTPGPWGVVCDGPWIQSRRTTVALLQDGTAADGRLIAAAPDLLEAAKFALETINRPVPDTAKGLRAAIAKAEAE